MCFFRVTKNMCSCYKLKIISRLVSEDSSNVKTTRTFSERFVFKSVIPINNFPLLRGALDGLETRPRMEMPCIYKTSAQDSLELARQPILLLTTGVNNDCAT